MKNIILVLAIFLSVTAFVACNDKETETNSNTKTETETIIIKDGDKEENEGALERAGSKIDVKANKEIDKQIDKIDD